MPGRDLAGERRRPRKALNRKEQNKYTYPVRQAGFEPVTYRLKADYSTIELLAVSGGDGNRTRNWCL